ncbi:Protein AIM2 [Fusarium oxysporum f. sp. albedinis]|nr:Protein AIM2 [Fusarium oxysporum f. sp. albedinis]
MTRRKIHDSIHGRGIVAHITEAGVILGTKPTTECMQLLRKAEHSCVCYLSSASAISCVCVCACRSSHKMLLDKASVESH